ncbi:MAG: TolB family protein [Candidatus Neomarinimicrobiota bacterium]
MTYDTTFVGHGLRYSPDGQFITFVGGMNKNEIYIMNADGSDIQRITNNTTTEHFLSWSPDGTRLVFMVGSLHDGGHLYIINIDGTGLTQITTGEAKYFTPEWRPYTKL